MILLLFQFIFINPSLDKIIANGENISFDSQKTIQFKALHDDIRFFFAKPQAKIDSFSYKLDRFDKNWISTLYPEARYTKLSGGDYTLNIKAFANGNVIEEHKIMLSIEKELREEWWFVPSLILYALILISAGIYFYLLYNFRQKLKVQAIRNRIASDLHDEVGATLSSIAFAINLARRKLGDRFPEIQPLLAQIKTDSEDSVHTIRDTVWAISPDNDSVEQLFEKMRSFGFQMLTSKEITFEYINEITDYKNLKITMEQRRNVYLIFKEAINNIAKHSEAKSAKTTISQVDEGIQLEIQDTGRGFDLKSDFEGNGLKNYQKRANEGFMTFEIDSELSKGTHIKLIIPEI